MVNPTKELCSTAFHESGHVIAAWHLGLKFVYVTIKPEENTLGHVKFNSKTAKRLASINNTQKEPSPFEKCLVEKNIITDFAGFFAQKKFTGIEDPISASGDYRNAVDAASIICNSIEI